LTSGHKSKLELADSILENLDFLLPKSDAVGKPIVAIAIDGANTLVDLARLLSSHGLDGLVVEIVVLQLLLLALLDSGDVGSFHVEAALLDLLLELWKMSVQYCRNIVACPTRLIVVRIGSWTALWDLLTTVSILLLIVPSALSACLMLRSAAPCCLFAWTTESVASFNIRWTSSMLGYGQCLANQRSRDNLLGGPRLRRIRLWWMSGEKGWIVVVRASK
jgi:hypothetical protein